MDGGRGEAEPAGQDVAHREERNTGEVARPAAGWPYAQTAGPLAGSIMWISDGTCGHRILIKVIGADVGQIVRQHTIEFRASSDMN